MEDLKKILEPIQRTTDASNQSPTGANAVTMPSFSPSFEVERSVDNSKWPSLLGDRRQTNAVDEHRHYHLYHESLNDERLENSSSFQLLLQYEEIVNEHRDSEFNKLKRIIDIYKKESLSKDNRIKQLIIEINKLKNENILRVAQDNEDKIVIDKYQCRIIELESQLNNFNEDNPETHCLLKVFSYLAIDDMMQVKRVCKKWYQASQQWFKQVQTLVYNEDDIGNGRLEFYKKNSKRKINEETKTEKVMPILHSCGHHIKNFKMKIATEEVNSTEEREKFIFQWLPILCKNIVDVQISGNNRWNLKFMAAYWKNLEKINFRPFPQSDKNDFFELLRNNKQLKTLKLWLRYDRKYLINDEFFTYIPITIREIVIENMSIMNKEELNHFIFASKNFISLQSLELSYFYYLTDAVAAAIANIKSLTHLNLHRVIRFESRRTIDPITNLKGLKSLNLSYTSDLYEDNFINIVEGCKQLEHLDIHYGVRLTDKGMTAIAKLNRLKYLKINAVHVSTEAIINSCGSLVVFTCTHSAMENSDAIKLLEKAINLRFVGFFCCRYLTEDILQEANDIANKRKNKILCMTGYFDCAHDIDTPYFKYFTSGKEMPLELFPNNIRSYMKLLWA